MVKKYLMMYYFSFLITITLVIYTNYKALNLLNVGKINISNDFSNCIFLIDFIMVIIFTVLIFKKKKISVNNTLLPVVYICFFIVVLILCFLFNSKVIIPYMHFGYYLIFINIGLLFLNIYSFALIKK